MNNKNCISCKYFKIEKTKSLIYMDIGCQNPEIPDDEEDRVLENILLLDAGTPVFTDPEICCKNHEVKT